MPAQLVAEAPDHFVLDDGKGQFRVPIEGLSPSTLETIRGLSKVDMGTMADSPPTPLMSGTAPEKSYSEIGGAGALPPGAQLGAGGGSGSVYDVTRDGNIKDVGQMQAGGVGAPPPDYTPSRIADRTDLPADLRLAGDHSKVKPPPDAPPPAAPVVAALPKDPSFGSPGLGDIKAGIATQGGAAVQGANVAAEGARQEAAARGAYETQLKQNQVDDQLRAEKASMLGAEMVSKSKALSDEMKNIDTTVDPGRFWATRSTGGKIAGILGLVLGALGTGPDGVNKASQMLNQAIDRDMDAQKAEHTLRLQKGRQQLESLQSGYALQQQIFGNETAASAAWKASALGLVENQLKKIASSTAGGAANPAAIAMLGQLQQQKGQLENAAAATATDEATKRIAADAARTGSEAQMIAATTKATKPGKNDELAKGAQQAARDLENELITNPTSPRIGQLRASLKLHLNKLQGGRFNEEINNMNEALIPGNEGWSAWQRAQGKMAPDAVRKKFEILDKHILATANSAPNPVSDQ